MLVLFFRRSLALTCNVFPTNFQKEPVQGLGTFVRKKCRKLELRGPAALLPGGSVSLSTLHSSIADRLLQGIIESSPAAHYPPLSSHYSPFPVRSRQMVGSVLGRDKGQQLVAASHLGSFCASAKLNANNKNARVARGQAVNHGRNRVLRRKITAKSLQRDASC